MSTAGINVKGGHVVLGMSRASSTSLRAARRSLMTMFFPQETTKVCTIGIHSRRRDPSYSPWVIHPLSFISFMCAMASLMLLYSTPNNNPSSLVAKFAIKIPPVVPGMWCRIFIGREFKKESTTQVSFNCSYNTGDYL